MLCFDNLIKMHAEYQHLKNLSATWKRTHFLLPRQPLPTSRLLSNHQHQHTPKHLSVYLCWPQEMLPDSQLFQGMRMATTWRILHWDLHFCFIIRVPEMPSCLLPKQVTKFTIKLWVRILACIVNMIWDNMRMQQAEFISWKLLEYRPHITTIPNSCHLVQLIKILLCLWILVMSQLL